MKALLVVGAGLAATAGHASDPVTDCRAAHSADPPAHVACLERALGAQKEEVDAPASTQDLGALPTAERVREIEVEIVSATYASGLGVFELADGQVWRETDKTPQQLRLEPGTRYRARIERGTLGGYRMYVEGVRRMLKVKRVK